MLRDSENKTIGRSAGADRPIVFYYYFLKASKIGTFVEYEKSMTTLLKTIAKDCGDIRSIVLEQDQIRYEAIDVKTRTEKELMSFYKDIKNDGYANKYILHLNGMNVMYLTKGEFNILNWLAILLAHRKFDITSPIGNSAREFILSRFMPDTTNIDIMIGYRADDSYFSFAEDFVNNTISLRDLNIAMQLGTLDEQVVLISKRSFKQIEFVEYEVADYREYYYKRTERDQNARATYANQKKSIQQLMDDIFVLDIMREDMKHDDSRLQSVISK